MKDFLLQLLSDGPTYVYEASRQYASFRDKTFQPMECRAPLMRLEKQGVVKSYYESEKSAASHQGPRRKMYKLI